MFESDVWPWMDGRRKEWRGGTSRARGCGNYNLRESEHTALHILFQFIHSFTTLFPFSPIPFIDTCVKTGERLAQDRAERNNEIERMLMMTVKKPISMQPPKPPLRPGEKRRKKHKKLPGWIIFNPDLSSIYPEVSFH